MAPDEALRLQAGACGRLGSAMYADLLARAAADAAAGGPVAAVLAGHDDDPGPSGLALRFAGSVHRLVLERRAGALATYYPSVGGTWSPAVADACWTAFRDLVAQAPDAVAEWLDRPPQTNEVGRASALMAGLVLLEREVGRPVRLVEIGSSGGLNLMAERFTYVDDAGTAHGPDSPVVLDPAWRGRGPWVTNPWTTPAPSWPTVVERRGSDVRPVDVRTTEGRLALTAYVWPDQTHRHERLRGALDLARTTPYDVQRVGAADLLEGLAPADGVLTVVWHSVMWQYLEAEEQRRARAALEALGAAATPEAPVAHLCHEPTRRTPGAEHEFLLTLELWPAAPERRVLARVHSHGVPTTWES